MFPNKTIKILFVSNWSKANPYQNLMMSSLRSREVDVAIDDYQAGFLGLFKTIKKHGDVDIVHIHWIRTYILRLLNSKNGFEKCFKFFAHVLDICLVKLSGTKIVWTVHNVLSHDSKSIFWEKNIRRFLFIIADRVFVHSESAVDEIHECYKLKKKDRVSVIPHGHYIGSYPNHVSKEQARREFNIGINDIVYLYFGQIRSYKGVPELIFVFKKCRALKKVKLLLAGKPAADKMKQEIQELVSGENNIKLFLRFIPRERVQMFMNASDVVIFPFKKILTSGSVVLTMSFSEPVVVPRLGSLRDLLDDKGAFFVDENTPLEAVLEQCINGDYQSMGRHNRKLIEQYSWDNIGRDLTEIYNNICKRD